MVFYIDSNSLLVYMENLKQQGVNILVLVIWKMLILDGYQFIVLLDYVKNVCVVGFDLIVWFLEWSGFFVEGGGWYYQSVSEVINNDGDMFMVLDVLVRDVGVMVVFLDWFVIIMFYVNCMGLVGKGWSVE